MSQSAQEFLKSFDDRSDAVRRWISNMIELPPLTDDDLMEAAENLFRMLDTTEGSDGQHFEPR
jgi:type I restriction-modification system DNA methylase subunit